MQTSTRKKRKFKKYLPLYLMMVPGIAYLVINNYIPMGGLVIAFKKFNYQTGIWGSPFNGLSNFKYLFTGKDSALIIRNTLLYNLVFILLGTVASVATAILLNAIRKEWSRKALQTFILIPYLISMVIVSYMVFAFLSQGNGFVNNTILAGLGKDPIAWYAEPKYWPFILTFIHLWKNFGYSAIIYYASLLSIDESLFEAARIDGATEWQCVRNVTLPGLRPTVITMVLLQIGRIFYSDFGLFYQIPMNSGMLINATSTIDTYVYRALMTQNDVGRSSAAGFLQSILGFIIVLTANQLVRKIDSENALF